jgi:hypothetical protein
MSAPLLSEWSSYLGALLASLHSPTVRAQKPLVKALTQLLPLVTRGERPLMAQLLGALAPYAAFDAYDESLHQDAAHTFGLECLVATLSSFKGAAASPLAQRIKRAVLEHRLHATGANLASTAAAYLVSRLPSNMDTGSQLWAAALARPALPYVLQLLGGLAQGHDAQHGRIFGLAATDGVDGRFLDVVGRIEVGLADRQIDDVDPRGGQRLGPRRHGKRCGGLERVHPRGEGERGAASGGRWRRVGHAGGEGAGEER